MEDKKKLNEKPEEEKKEKKAIDLDELEEVAGGSIRNVRFTKTKDISPGTKDKI